MSHPAKLGWRFAIYRSLCRWHYRLFGVSPGVYLQDPKHTSIGPGCYIAPNVAIITTDHRKGDLASYEEPQGVRIGQGCWLGFGCVILPGVELGPNTIVGANAVVTRSYPQGGLTLVGAPARPVEVRA